MRSEEALNNALAGIEARLNHETNTVATEKKLIADLKKLESQREKVCALCVSLWGGGVLDLLNS